MNLTKLAVLLSGAALSASVLAGGPAGSPFTQDPLSPYFAGSRPQYKVDETKPATPDPVPFGDENDTSWMTPQAKPAFSGHAAAAGDELGLPNDLDEQAVALGKATHGTSMFAGKGNAAVGSE